MARPLRIQYANAIYHVMSRGDRRQDIFRQSEDRILFLETLAGACGKTQWQLHAYCLMSNHFDSLAPACSAFGLPVHVAAPQLAPFTS